MTRSIRGSRRAALLLTGMATATGLLLSGCGAGQVSETAKKAPSVQGVDLNVTLPAGEGSYAVRGLLVEFPGTEGYKAGADAVLNAVLYNDSRNSVTVTVSTESAREVVLTGTGASASPSASPSESSSGSPSPEPSGSPSAESPSPGSSASPSVSPGAPESPAASETPAPAGEPARIEIPPLSYVRLNAQSDRVLKLIGLNEALRSGQNVILTFDFGNGDTVTGVAPVAVPLTPAAPPSQIVERLGGYDENEGGGH